MGVLTLEALDVLAPSSKVPLLSGINLFLPCNHFAAIVGPSGCGKSTLIKVIAGILPHKSGTIRWHDRNLSECDLLPGEFAYVPQFTFSQPRLTVEENVMYAARFRRIGTPAEIRAEVERTLEETGLSEIRKRKAGILSGGQSRRLGLAIELITDPCLLLADEVTSGLDPKSEEEITSLLAKLSKRPGRLVVLVTHSLRFLHNFDSVSALVQGSLAYSAHPHGLFSYFNINSPEDVYPRLMERNPSDWALDWNALNSASDYPDQTLSLEPKPKHLLENKFIFRTPGFWSQTMTCFSRRLKLFLRDPAQIILQLCLLITFPLMVSIFAYKGLPEISNMSMNLDTNVIQQLKETVAFTLQSSRIGTLVSGLAMFQAVLLALMGSNNSAREVVGQRVILEKEKLAGLRPGSFFIATLIYLSLLVILQSFWMVLFVTVVCHFPVDFLSQFVPFAMLTASITSLCLAISTWSSNSEQASLGSLYLVGFQLPLSGVLLALPEFLGWVIRPFISSYWAWSGYIQSFKNTRFYDMVQSITDAPIAIPQTSIWVLSIHLGLGLFFSYMGIRRCSWE